jgi:hypothetical protein
MEYIYELPPTDCFQCFVWENELKIDHDFVSDIESIKESIARAKYLFAKYSSWEGDGSCYISALPCEDSYPLIFVTVKQSNNGDTYLYSPIILKHIEKYLTKII